MLCEFLNCPLRVFTFMDFADILIRRNVHYIEGVHFYQFMHGEFCWDSNPWSCRCQHHALLFEIQEIEMQIKSKFQFCLQKSLQFSHFVKSKCLITVKMYSYKIILVLTFW